MKWPSDIKLVTRELPVDYKIVRDEVKNLWETEKPDVNPDFFSRNTFQI